MGTVANVADPSHLTRTPLRLHFLLPAPSKPSILEYEALLSTLTISPLLSLLSPLPTHRECTSPHAPMAPHRPGFGAGERPGLGAPLAAVSGVMVTWAPLGARTPPRDDFACINELVAPLGDSHPLAVLAF